MIMVTSSQFSALNSFSTSRLLLGSVYLILILAISRVHSFCDQLFQAPKPGTSEYQDGGSYSQQNGPNTTTTAMRFQAPIRTTANLHSIWLNESSGELFFGPHPNGSIIRRNAIHCLYKFVANEGERVALSFDSSRMLDSEPQCASEYVDIYVKFRPDEPIEEAIGREPPNGRFCTANLPHKVVSLFNTIVLSIYSDQPPSLAENQSMFSGRYEFIKAPVVSPPATTSSLTRLLGSLGSATSAAAAASDGQIGPPDAGTLCSHTIYSSSKREGEFQSITYPGVYVKNLRCSYRFVGTPGERVRIEFLDLDLYSGGAHCPFDSIRIFDGLDETDPLIQLICGSHRSLTVYSTHEHLLITFTTLQRGAEVLNRGYSAYFEFSDRFFQPNFIQGPNARHMRGSECDQRIVSTRGSRGSVVSPDWRANRPNTVCRYYFEGLQSSHDYEKVLLKFVEFDLKASSYKTATTITTSQPVKQQQQQVTTTTLSPYGTTTSTSQPFSSEDDSKNSYSLALFLPFLNNSTNLLFLNQTINLNISSLAQADLTNTAANGSSGALAADQCPDNYVRLYTGEQKPDQKQDPNDYDYIFCGNELPTTIESDAASLIMEYNSGSLGGYFKAEYSFTVDFRISGYQIPQLGCNYVYRSDVMKTGIFSSPRHPSWYINDMNCTYTFLTRPDEVLLLQFTAFKMANSTKTVELFLGHNEFCDAAYDQVEINGIALQDNPTSRRFERFRIGTYCYLSTPGPILSYKPVQINLITNKKHVDYGFSASYTFHWVSDLRTNEFVSNCGGRIESSQGFGTFSSPPTYRAETYEKRNHICTWNITAPAGRRISLHFTRFELEGSPTARGCASAVVRLEFDPLKLATELCGTNNSMTEYTSTQEWFVVTFISTKRASGSNGFTASWVERAQGWKPSGRDSH